MPTDLHILGIRHHGPGSARMIQRALDKLKPLAVLIEGPPDAHEVISLAADSTMSPPVALLVYDADNPRNAAYYPFAEFSPEWQAIRWALANNAEVRFIDLPWANRAQPDESNDESESPALIVAPARPPTSPPSPASPPTPAPSAPASATDEDQSAQPSTPPHRPDPLDLLALAAGYDDGEAWWGRLIEERRGHDDPLAVFTAITHAMAAGRAAELTPDPATTSASNPSPSASVAPSSPPSSPSASAAPSPASLSPRDTENLTREAHMRRAIRAAIKEGFGNIAVICGAYHAPVLTQSALDSHPAKADDALLKGLPKRKTTATWIPWTYDRLSMWSGYGAGVDSPGWYDHLWHNAADVEQRWMVQVARLLRAEDLDASPAHVIEASRLATTLAYLRDRATVSLSELNEATLSVMCSGNTMPLRLIHRKLIVGERLGATPDATPVVPLQRDLTAQQKSLRLKVSADDTALDLDQRKDLDLERSRLLHRLCILKINWATLQSDTRRTKGTFHELWKLQWQPELAIAVVEAARWGNTIHDAAAAFVQSAADSSNDLPHLTTLLDHVLLADLPTAVPKVIARIAAVSAVAADVAHLMAALPALAGVLRYGNVRNTDTALVEPIIVGLIARICAGLGPACASLDDDAAAAMIENINAVNTALTTLDRADLTTPWQQRLAQLSDADIHGQVAGRATRLLMDAHILDAAASGQRLSLALSRGNDPAKASAWLEGFISGSGLVLVHDRALLGIIDTWLCDLTKDTFDLICPIVRRTFSTFAKPERRQIGEALKRAAPLAAPGAPTPGDLDPARVALVDPVLALILGEPL